MPPKGVLAVNAAARANPTKAPARRLKLEVRRLPPGLTAGEFEEVLGDEWKVGSGKVDWKEYRQGKTRLAGSGKAAEQSRCYIHVVDEVCIKEFEKRFLEVQFHDKAGTFKNPDLKNLQPSLGFALNQRTPLQQAKQRADNRQGTIDQDAEFIAFLEGETQPITKAAALDAANAEKEHEREQVKTTPLIEDLREKKANKAKAAQAKAEKAEKDKKTQATKQPAKDAPTPAEKDTGKKPQQQKIEQAAKDAAKVLNKQAASKQAAKAASPSKAKKPVTAPKSTESTITPPSATSNTSATTVTSAPQRPTLVQRQRGNADGIKKMLQKDLGIKPKATPAIQQQPTASTSTPTSPPTTSTTSATPSAPLVAPAPTTPIATVPPESRPPATKAYLKHANPSQGMTEVLIQQALSTFGDLNNVTIDPRKGTAIAFFKDNEGLRKALDAKRVSVANGAVEVLEYRDRPANRGGFGRRGRGGRGGGAAGASTVGTAAPPADG